MRYQQGTMVVEVTQEQMKFHKEWMSKKAQTTKLTKFHKKILERYPCKSISKSEMSKDFFQEMLFHLIEKGRKKKGREKILFFITIKALMGKNQFKRGELPTNIIY